MQTGRIDTAGDLTGISLAAVSRGGSGQRVIFNAVCRSQMRIDTLLTGNRFVSGDNVAFLRMSASNIGSLTLRPFPFTIEHRLAVFNCSGAGYG